MVTSDLSKVYRMLDALSREDRQKIAAYINSTIQVDAVDEAWEIEELEALFTRDPDGRPLTGKEIYERGLASGAIGGWADDDIQDGAEWVNQQKAKRADKHQW